MPDLARAVVVHERGPASVMRVQDVPVPTPGAGQVLVEVEAAGVAYADVLMRLGLYPETPKLPFTPGYDLVGRVVAHGPDVREPAVGTRVAALTVTGSCATHAVADVGLLAPVPDGVDAGAACALVLNWVTAHQMLHRVARVPSGADVLVLGAAGGVGTALLELSRLAGIRAIGTASGAERTATVQALGGVAIDRRTQDVAAEVGRLAPSGVTAAFDAVGGPQLGATRRLVRTDGTVVSYGISFAAEQGLGKLTGLARHGLGLARAKVTPGARVELYVIVGSRSFHDRHPSAFGEDLGALLGRLAAGEIAPRVTTLPLAEVATAHERLEAGEVEGKIVLDPRGA